MQRCPFPRKALVPLCALVLLAALPPLPRAVHAQAVAAGQRTFPATAKVGALKVLTHNQAELDGRPVRLAPGLRIFNERNALVFAHTLQPRAYVVRYVIEASTGMLLTAWLLTPAEAEQARRDNASHTPQTVPAHR